MGHWNVSAVGINPPPWAENWISSVCSFIEKILCSHEELVSKILPKISEVFFEANEFLQVEKILEKSHDESVELMRQFKQLRIEQKENREILISLSEEKKSCLASQAHYQNTEDSHTWEDQDEIDRLKERLNEIEKIQKNANEKKKKKKNPTKKKKKKKKKKK